MPKRSVEKLNLESPSNRRVKTSGGEKGLGDLLDAIVTLLNEVRDDLNSLRQDFRRHDHGATYTAATHRINAGNNTPSGTEASSDVAAAKVDALL